MARRPRRRLATPIAVGSLLLLPAALMGQDETRQPDATEPAPGQAEPSNPDRGQPAEPADADRAGGADPGADAEIDPNDLRECEVFFFDGRRIRGRLVSIDDERLVLSIRGIQTPFDRSEIAYHRVFPPVREQYRSLRAGVRDQDAPQLIRLAEWCMERRLYEEALRDLGTALTFDPGNRRASDLQIVAAQQIALANRQREEAEEEDRPEPRVYARVPLLTPDQINLIKVYEVDLDDPPKITIAPEAINRFIDEYEEDNLVPGGRAARVAMLRKPPAELLELAFRLRARDYYNEFKVQGEPESLNKFRSNVHAGWLMNSCATSSCHGGQSAGRLWLSNRRPRAERTVYTNFLILDRFELDDGTPLLDWDRPEESPLLQMTLPREISLHPHPEIVRLGNERPWRPVFGSTDDRGFQRAVDWMRSMYRPRPSYPVSYEPPVPAGFIPDPPAPEGPIER